MAHAGRRLIVGGIAGQAGADDVVLDPIVWYVVGSAAVSICGVSLEEPFVPGVQAVAMAAALEGADLKWFTSQLAGMEHDPTAFDVMREWLDGEDGRERLRAFLGFLRSGDFRIVRVAPESFL